MVIPNGALNAASVPVPSVVADSPEPANVVTSAVAITILRILFPRYSAT